MELLPTPVYLDQIYIYIYIYIYVYFLELFYNSDEVKRNPDDKISKLKNITQTYNREKIHKEKD